MKKDYNYLFGNIFFHVSKIITQNLKSGIILIPY